MKGCITAGCVLLFVVLLVIANAAYVRWATDDILKAVETLPEVPDPATTPDEVATVRMRFESHTTWLNLSLNYNQIDRATETFLSLEAAARTGDERQYAISLAVLRDMIENLARYERVKAEVLF